MKEDKTIQANRRLLVQFRLEAGCLGPNGTDHIVDFCDFALAEIKPLNADFIEWEIMPRLDKLLPEIEYRLSGKRLNINQVSKYFQSFNHQLADFEALLDEKLTMSIEHYLNR